jgi:hypothetical protein
LFLVRTTGWDASDLIDCAVAQSHLAASVDDTFAGFTFTDQSVLMQQMQSQR